MIIGKMTSRYDLIGVVNHMGHCGGGHYVSYINMSQQPDDPACFDWVCYDDSRCLTLTKKQVEDNRNAYILFYKLRH